jgi:hypothetical protein
MSTFEIPSTICSKLDALNRRFWWNPKGKNGRFLALKSWDKLCLPKKNGGLGFRKSKDFNLDLIAKLSWMVASNRESICMRMLRSKYKVQRDWLSKSPPKNSSPIWRAIEMGKNVIVKCACLMVGNGENISVWKDPWVPYLEDFKSIPRDASSQVRPLMVSNLIDPQTRFWKQDVLGQLFTQSSIEAINKIVIPWRPRPDKLVWVKEPIGDFFVKYAYKLSQELSTTSNEVGKNLEAQSS